MTIAANSKNKKNLLKIPVLIYRAITKTKTTLTKAVPMNKISITESTHETKTQPSLVTQTKCRSLVAY